MQKKRFTEHHKSNRQNFLKDVFKNRKQTKKYC